MATLNSPVKIVDRPLAVNGVLASFGMEGLGPDAATAALLEQYAAGSISLEQFGAAIESHVAQVRTAGV